MTLFVKFERGAEWAEVSVVADATCSVGRLKNLIMAQMPSLRNKDATDITLHRAEVDAAGKLVAVEEAALPVRMSLAGSKLVSGASIIIKVAPATEATVTASPGGSSACRRFSHRVLRALFPHPSVQCALLPHHCVPCASSVLSDSSVVRALLLHPCVLRAGPSMAAIPPLEDTHIICRVVAAIRGGAVMETADGHLLLPAGLNWPAASNNTLFVRHFAAPLFESILNRCMPVPGMPLEHQRRIVTGQPGIGKSVWG